MSKRNQSREHRRQLRRAAQRGAFRHQLQVRAAYRQREGLFSLEALQRLVQGQAR